MTPDLDAIRAALAAATRPCEPDLQHIDPWSMEMEDFILNAPVWLASLISEVERLRADDLPECAICEEEETCVSIRPVKHPEDAPMLVCGTCIDAELRSYLAERDAALAECSRLRAELDNYDEEQRIQREKDDR